MAPTLDSRRTVFRQILANRNADDGSYTVNVTVTDDSGATGSANETVSVQADLLDRRSVSRDKKIGRVRARTEPDAASRAEKQTAEPDTTAKRDDATVAVARDATAVDEAQRTRDRT